MHKLAPENTAALYSAVVALWARGSEARVMHRMHCVLAVGRGSSCYEVGEWFSEDPRTIERWVRRYNEFGVPGLMGSRTGRPRRLRRAWLRQLEGELRRSPQELGYGERVWNGPLLQAHLGLCYGVALGVRQCQRLLRRSP